MKRKAISIFFISLICILATSLPSNAVILNRIEQAQNTLTLSIDTEMGLVRTLTATFRITGDVKLEKLIWANNIKESYIKREIYDEKNNTVTIFIATGNNDNLVDNTGKVIIGNVLVTAKGKEENKTYNVTLDNIELLDANYIKTVPTEKVENTKDSFNYIGNSTTDPEPGENTTGNNTSTENVVVPNNTTDTNTNNESSGNTTNNTNGQNSKEEDSNQTDNKKKEEKDKNFIDKLVDKILPKTGSSNIGFKITLTIIAIICILGIVLILRKEHIQKKGTTKKER